ncbi:MAG TPA: ABC transporter permease [Actinophytocola sp.]|nr:ABC transporter permease [Actinophytocola sp.]
MNEPSRPGDGGPDSDVVSPGTGGTDLHSAVLRRGGRKERNRSLWADARHDLVRNPMFIVSSLIVLAVLTMTIAPSLWTDTNPKACDLTLSKQAPSAGHPFGRTLQGCDLYAQVIYGARPSVVIAVLVTAATAVLGTLFGTLAAFYGGWVDAVISRITDVFFGLPFIVGALLFLSVLDSHSIWAVSAILVALGWTQLTRIMRGSVMEIMARDYVRAARGLGASDARIIFQHLLPNAIAPVVVISTVSLGAYVSAEATLTFLGVGLRPPEISWGILISIGDGWALAGHWHMLVFPCAFLIVTVLAFIMMGDALRDALDPKLR